MPSDINQLAAGRQLTRRRRVLDCPATATTLRQGLPPHHGSRRPGSHSCAPPTPRPFPGWPGTAADTDGLRLSCGSVLDYRSAEQLLPSHADLWLTPLTRVAPKRGRTPESGPTSWTRPAT